MEIKVSLNYLRISPRKVRLVSNLILKNKVQEATRKLKLLNKRAAKPLLKLLNSAIANAKNNFGFEEKRIDSLYIKNILVNEGPKIKRWRPVARGSAHPIQKKTSHITLVLEEKVLEKKKQNRTVKR